MGTIETAGATRKSTDCTTRGRADEPMFKLKSGIILASFLLPFASGAWNSKKEACGMRFSGSGSSLLERYTCWTPTQSDEATVDSAAIPYNMALWIPFYGFNYTVSVGSQACNFQADNTTLKLLDISSREGNSCYGTENLPANCSFNVNIVHAASQTSSVAGTTFLALDSGTTGTTFLGIDSVNCEIDQMQVVYDDCDRNGKQTNLLQRKMSERQSMKTKYGTSPSNEKQLQQTSFAKTLSEKCDEVTDDAPDFDEVTYNEGLDYRADEQQQRMSFAKTLSAKCGNQVIIESPATLSPATQSPATQSPVTNSPRPSESDVKVASYSCAENNWECFNVNENFFDCGKQLLFYFPEITVERDPHITETDPQNPESADCVVDEIGEYKILEWQGKHNKSIISGHFFHGKSGGSFMDAAAIECGATTAVVSLNSMGKHYVYNNTKPMATVAYYDSSGAALEAKDTGDFAKNSSFKVGKGFHSLYCEIDAKPMEVRLTAKKALYEAEYGISRLDMVIPGWDMESATGGLAQECSNDCKWHLRQGPLEKYAGIASSKCGKTSKKAKKIKLLNAKKQHALEPAFRVGV